MSLVVIEGVDGAGKSTQMRLMQEYLTQKHQSFKYIHFPRTENSSVYGSLISRFLRGELGDIHQVNAYLVALIYAGDRFDCKKQLQEWLENGETVLLDRYVYSNVAYQCAKVAPEEVEALKQWILELEFGYFGLPRPDLNLFLDVPFQFTKNKLTQQRAGNERGYLQGKTDIHEADLAFQQRVHDIYTSLDASEDRFYRIDCSDGADVILPPEAIFQFIVDRWFAL